MLRTNIQTHAIEDFEICVGCAEGLQHQQYDVPLQDSVRLDSSKNYILLAISDGVGSSKLSHIGANIATKASIDFLLEFEVIDRNTLLDAVDYTRDCVFQMAKEHNSEVSELACTLQILCIPINSVGYSYYRIGDGGTILFFEDGTPKSLYPDETLRGKDLVSDFISDSAYIDVNIIDKIEAWIGFTDGLEPFFYDKKKNSIDINNVSSILKRLSSKKVFDLSITITKYFSSEANMMLRDDKSIIAGIRTQLVSFTKYKNKPINQNKHIEKKYPLAQTLPPASLLISKTKTKEDNKTKTKEDNKTETKGGSKFLNIILAIILIATLFNSYLLLQKSESSYNLISLYPKSHHNIVTYRDNPHP